MRPLRRLPQRLPGLPAGRGVFGSVYTGGIGVLLTAFFTSWEEATRLQDLCLGCQRCKEYCSAGIDLPALIQELRRRAVAEKGLGTGTRLVVDGLLPRPRLLHASVKVAARLQRPWVREGRIDRVPFFTALARGRSLPPLASLPFRERVRSLSRPASSRGRVLFFSGCLIDYIFPELGEAVARVLAAMGWELIHPEEQGCCGFPAWQSGRPEGLIRLARYHLRLFAAFPTEPVLTACPTCAVALRQLYPQVLQGEERIRAQALADRVTEFSSFVWEHREDLLPQLLPMRKRVTYHDSCHLKFSLRAERAPRELLRLLGSELVETEPPELCCGFGGSFTLKQPGLSRAILDRKLQAIAASRASTVALDCPGCLWQIGSAFAGETKHTATILAENLKYPST
ncbi:(Fe-S)-binding protein [Desulfothermobacter acidiphilus]|uniref:(Fe-S)-binding protein n=1 Tax=Desulfothermobacter acidiphilus TaxID=1938353 RepID=UPI003F89C8C1